MHFPMRGRLRKFINLPAAEKLLFLEALFFQLTTGLILKVLPFRLIPRLFKNPMHSPSSQLTTHDSRLTTHSSQFTPDSSLLTPHSSYLTPHTLPLQIKEALRRSSPLSPWKNKCLVSSLAARCMLKRRKIRSDLFLGVGKNEAGRMVAHAWIIADGIEMVPKGELYMEIKSF